MHQFSALNQSFDRAYFSNSFETNKTPDRFAVSHSSLVFSPHSEQNFMVDNLVCQSYPSPSDSFYHSFSPVHSNAMLQNSGAVTPVNKNGQSKPHEVLINILDDLSLQTPDFILPLKIENINVESFHVANNENANKHNFNHFSNCTANSLTAFLKGQIFEQYFPKVEIPMAVTLKVTEIDSNADSKSARIKMSLSDSPSVQADATSDSRGSTQFSLSVRFKHFNSVICAVFSSGKVEESVFASLSVFEQSLLYFLVKRKYLPKVFKNPHECSENPSYVKLIKILQTPCNKRPEECYKFILTRVIKFLKRKFETPYKTKAQVEETFYEVYFKGTSIENDISLSDFHYPLTGSFKGKFKLNSNYFSKIFKSNSFVDALKEYCQELLLKEYTLDIQKKLMSLMSRWSEMLDKKTESQQEIENEIMSYVIFNKRCKLPWSVAEVSESIEKFCKLVYMYQPYDVENKPNEDLIKTE